MNNILQVQYTQSGDHLVSGAPAFDSFDTAVRLLRQFFFSDLNGSAEIQDSQSKNSARTGQSVQLEIDAGIATVTLRRCSDVGVSQLAQLARDLETSFFDRSVSAKLRAYRNSIPRSVMMQRYVILRDDDTVANIVLESRRLGHSASESDEWVASSSDINTPSPSKALVSEIYAKFQGTQQSPSLSVELMIDGEVEVLPVSAKILERASSFAMNDEVWVRIVNVPSRRVVDICSADSVEGREQSEPDVAKLFDRWSGVMERLA